MINKGVIVSIQGYSQATTQELANKAVKGGAVAIRTDQRINVDVPVIGLQKIPDKKYYITTSKEAIKQVMVWSNYIAIDCRKGNQELELLLSLCHVFSLKYVADIECEKDVNNLLTMCERKGLIQPAYISTTFGYKKDIEEKLSDIREIKEITRVPLIAEGGYEFAIDVSRATGYTGRICIGTAISDVEKLTEKYKGSVCY
jgi:putative N-acetylmannosamine-6-phosphate epimerase